MTSRRQAARCITGPELRRRERRGIAVRGASARGLAEETPQVYKDITQAVETAEGAGLCRKVARLVPLGDRAARDAERLAAMLRQVPGVAEAVVIAEEKLAYLKVDSKSFDAAKAESVAAAG